MSMNGGYPNTHIDDAVALLEKANADLQPELLTVPEAKELLDGYARARRLADFGIAALAARVENAAQVARVTGTSVVKAKEAIATGEVLASSAPLTNALRHGEVSLDQAGEIARAEGSQPGAAEGLLEVARNEGFQVLRDKARKVCLEAEQHRDLASRQRRARRAYSNTDELGMKHIHLTLEPHVGTPIEARAEAQARRLARAAQHAGHYEPLERHLADAYAELLSGGTTVPARRPELVVLVSHEVAKRGWDEVRHGEICKIPGVGPVSPQVAKEIAQDAFLSGVLFDGKDLRHFKRWTRHIPREVALALELGEPPDFDGVVCVDCGKHFGTELDHVEPLAAGGPTSGPNLRWRCGGCHLDKTEQDRKAGKLKPGGP